MASKKGGGAPLCPYADLPMVCNPIPWVGHASLWVFPHPAYKILILYFYGILMNTRSLCPSMKGLFITPAEKRAHEYASLDKFHQFADDSVFLLSNRSYCCCHASKRLSLHSLSLKIWMKGCSYHMKRLLRAVGGVLAGASWFALNLYLDYKYWSVLTRYWEMLELLLYVLT